MSLSNIAKRYLPPALELRGSNMSRLYSSFKTPRRDVRPFIFTKHNRILITEKSKIDIKRYIRGREQWVIIVLKHNVIKTIRFNEVVEHMIEERARARKYFLVKRHYTMYFRERYRTI